MPKKLRTVRTPDPILEIDMADLIAPREYAVSVFRVLALILYPDDAAAADTYMMSAAYDMLDREASLMTPTTTVTITGKPSHVEIRTLSKIAKEALSPVLKKRSRNSAEELEDRRSGLAVAVDLFHYSLILAIQGFPEAGINQVISEYGAMMKAKGFTGTNRADLEKAWRRYRPVVHIAAAVASVRGAPLQDPTTFFEIVKRSQAYLSAGSSIGSRFSRPVLPPGDCWTLALTSRALGIGHTRNSGVSVLSTRALPSSQ